MQRTLALLLALCLCMGLCACEMDTQQTTATEETSVSDEAYHQVEIQVMARLRARFRAHTSYVRVNISTFREIGENKWEAYGKASFNDEYGDTYSGKWSAIVNYDPERDSFGVSMEADDTFYKD